MLPFLEVFLIATVPLIPGQSERALAIEVTASVFALWFAQLAGQIRYLRQGIGHPWSWFVYRAILNQIATLPF